MEDGEDGEEDVTRYGMTLRKRYWNDRGSTKKSVFSFPR
jgi:hypothetical protein